MQAAESTQEANICSSLQGVSLLQGTLTGFDARPQTVRTLNQSQCSLEPLGMPLSSPGHASSSESSLSLDEVLMAYSGGHTVYCDKAEAVKKLRHRYCSGAMPGSSTLLPAEVQPTTYCAMHMRQDGFSEHKHHRGYSPTRTQVTKRKSGRQ